MKTVVYMKEYGREVGRNIRQLHSYFIKPEELFLYVLLASLTYPIAILEPVVETPVRLSKKVRNTLEWLAVWLSYPALTGVSDEVEELRGGKIVNGKTAAVFTVCETALAYFLGDKLDIKPPMAVAGGAFGFRCLEYLVGRLAGKNVNKIVRDSVNEIVRDELEAQKIKSP